MSQLPHVDTHNAKALAANPQESMTHVAFWSLTVHNVVSCLGRRDERHGALTSSAIQLSIVRFCVSSHFKTVGRNGISISITPPRCRTMSRCER